MKESVTKFDLEAAFKALDEIDVPVAKEVKANKPALNEIFSRKSKFDALMEEYYDISNNNDLTDAKEAREAEIAKAKLARIEKIVDLDAKSPEELLTSYVGKFIIQCPQCMTLFYKSPEDVEESEDDSNVVNVSEVCQHCGNETGYNLIGKVGEATEEEMDNFDTSELEQEAEDATEEDELTVDVDSTEESEEVSDEAEFDLDITDDELDELTPEEDEDDEDKKEESFSTHEGSSLVEQLNESAEESDVSAEEFEDLINSAEFKRPISDSDVRSMMAEMSESAEKNCDNEECDDSEALTEAGLGTLAKTLGKKIGQAGKKLKDKTSNAIDKFAESAKTRDEKADFVLENARKDYSKVKVNDGELVPDEGNRKFKVFLVVGYKDRYSDGQKITMCPSIGNKDLVVGVSQPKAFEKYADADKAASGWSKQEGKGLAIIYLAQGVNDEKALFLCQYFKGELKNDQLEKYYETVKRDLSGAAEEAAAEDKNVTPAEETKAGANVKTEKTTAANIKQGMKVQYGDESAEVTNVADSSFGKAITLKYADGNTEVIQVNGGASMTVITESLTDGIGKVIDNLDEIKDSVLESLISESLIDTYKNVAGFRLKECSYLNEQLNVEGTICFTSGKTRNTTYAFNEAMIDGDKVSFTGSIKKLGEDKKFIVTGSNTNKTFIAESFKRV